jgi:hypothetical protein
LRSSGVTMRTGTRARRGAIIVCMRHKYDREQVATTANVHFDAQHLSVLNISQRFAL